MQQSGETGAERLMGVGPFPVIGIDCRSRRSGAVVQWTKECLTQGVGSLHGYWRTAGAFWKSGRMNHCQWMQRLPGLNCREEILYVFVRRELRTPVQYSPISGQSIPRPCKSLLPFENSPSLLGPVPSLSIRLSRFPRSICGQEDAMFKPRDGFVLLSPGGRSTSP